MATELVRKCSVVVLLWSAGVFGIAPAFAQLEEVIVTAQKREESLQDVPLSVSVMSGELMRKMDYNQISNVSELVPNFNIGEAPGEYTVNIRGIGSATSNRAFEQSVGLYVDGIYTGRTQQFQAPFLDMARIEVVRGPQGVLFGKNSNAGAVSITSNRPQQDFYSSLRGTYEFEYGGWDFEGVLNGRLTETLSGRLAVKRQLEEAYMENSSAIGDDGPRTELGAIRGSVLWAPNENFQAYFKIDYANVDWKGTAFQVLKFSNAARGFYTAKDPNAEDNFDLRQQQDGDFLNGGGIDNGVESTAYVWQADYTFAEHTFTYLGGYSEYTSELGIDTDFGDFPGTYSSGGDEFDQVSHELRLTSPADRRFFYMAGLYYLDRHYEIPDWQFDAQFSQLPPPLPNFTRFRTYDEKATMWSGFAQGTWNITEQISLTGGLRYVTEDKTGDSMQITTQMGNVNNPIPGGIPIFPNYTFHGDRSEDSWNPTVNIQWEASDGIMFYASYNSAEKSGGFNSNSSVPIGIEYEPETAEGIEVGSKMELLDNQIRLNVALFSTDFDDYQVSSYNGVVQTVTNAASAKSQGVEVEFSWAATDKLTLSAQAAYLDATYEDFPNAPCAPINQPDCVGGLYRDASGERLTYAPKYSGSAFGLFTQPISDNLNLDMSLTAIFSAEYDTQIDKSPETTADSYLMWNARVGLASKDDIWGLALIGQNLTDERLFNFATNLPFFAGSAFAYTMPPRMIKLELSYQFE